MNTSGELASSLAIVFVGLLSLIFLVLYFWSIFWSYKDAVHRKKNGFEVALLVALFVWPFGVLLWLIFRPEKTGKTLIKHQSSKSDNIVINNFKGMPLLLKLLFLLSVYSFFQSAFNLFQMKPISFSYFGTNFPKNYPFIWHMYSLMFNLITIIVYIKKSFSVLKTYTYASVVVLAITLINSFYFTINLPIEQRMPTVVVYAVTYLFGGLIFVYILNQKKYFNKP